MLGGAKRTLKLLITFILALLIIAIILIAVLLQGFRTQMPECEKGPLEKIEKCKKDYATFTWMGSGWWYSDAIGVPSQVLIKQMHGNDKNVQISSSDVVEKVPCALVLAESDDGQKCFALQRVSGNGNARIFLALVISSDYKRARFFKGAQYMLLKGKPVEVGRKIHPDVPKMASDNLGG